MSKAKAKMTIKFKGGAGSGHRGHAGRPGKKGGSLPGTGGGKGAAAKRDGARAAAERAASVEIPPVGSRVRWKNPPKGHKRTVHGKVIKIRQIGEVPDPQRDIATVLWPIGKTPERVSEIPAHELYYLGAYPKAPHTGLLGGGKLSQPKPWERRG